MYEDFAVAGLVEGLGAQVPPAALLSISAGAHLVRASELAPRLGVSLLMVGANPLSPVSGSVSVAPLPPKTHILSKTTVKGE